ncbi:GNAT family N-acetyltransferase [Streptomyces sp. NPDC054958]
MDPADPLAPHLGRQTARQGVGDGGSQAEQSHEHGAAVVGPRSEGQLGQQRFEAGALGVPGGREGDARTVVGDAYAAVRQERHTDGACPAARCFVHRPVGDAAEVGHRTAGARGRGVAPRALEALTTWSLDVFRADGLERLELRHQVDDLASCRVAATCGHAYDRTLAATPPAFPLDGHPHVRRTAA